MRAISDTAKTSLKKYTTQRKGKIILPKDAILIDTNINITDALEDNIKKLIIYGQSTQDRTPTPDYPSEIESIGRKNIITSLASKWSAGINHNFDNLLIKETMTFSCIIDTSITSANLYIIPATGASAISLGTINFTANQRATKTFNLTDEQIQVIKSNQGGIFQIYKSSAFESANITDVQLEKGSTATDYVPYEHTEISVEVTGKNLLENDIITQTANGITFTKNDDGTVTANGTATANAVIDVGRTTLNSFNKGNYIASGCPSDGSSSTYQITLFKTIGTANTALGGDFGTSLNVTIDEVCQLWERIVIYSGQTVSSLVFKPMIRLASITDDTYEPYQSNTSSIDLQGNELCSLPNGTKDELVIENGKALLIKKIRHITRAIADMNNSDAYPGWANETQLKEDYPDKNDSFSYAGINIRSNITNDASQIKLNTKGTGILFFSSSLLNGMTQTEIKANYPDLVLDLYYELAEPETIDLGTVEMPHTYDGVNNISNSADTEMSVTYSKATENQQIYGIEYYQDCYDEGNVIGNTIASQLDFDLPYTEKFDSFKYYDGVWTGSEYEYIDMGTFTVFDEKDEDEFNKHITAFDNLIKFNAPYVDSVSYPISLYDLLKNICSQANVILDNESIPNGSFSVENNQFVNEENLKTVLKAICQVSGTFAIISNDKLKLLLKNETSESLVKSDHEPITWKRKTYGINQIILGMKDVEGEYVLKQDDDDIAKNGVHKLIINDNPFAYTQEKRQQLIDELYNQVNGFGYIPYELKSEWFNYLEVGDTINIDGIDTIVLRVNGKSPNALESEMSAPAIIDSAIDYVNNTDTINDKVKRTEIIVDKQQQQINLLNEKVEDISKTVNGQGTVTLTECSETPLYKLIITNIGDDSLLFPSSKTFPSSTTYLKNSLLYVNKGEENEATYDLKIPALRILDGTKDEYILENGKAKLIKRIGLDDNLKKYILDNPIETDLGEVIINLAEGTNTLTMPSFPNNQYTATYLLVNQYTNVFASQVSVTNQINVASDNILIESKSQILENGDELIASINTTSTGKVKIQASDTIALEGTTTVGDKIKFNLDGSITAQDLRLLDGGQVIGGNGLLTSMQFESIGQYNGYQMLGFNYDANGSVFKSDVNVTFNVPSNFEVDSAYATLLHTPINFWDFSNSEIVGYAKNLKLYKDTSGAIDKMYAGFLSSYWLETTNLSGTEITNAFGSSTYSPEKTGIGKLTTKTSIDIKDYITAGINTFFVRTTDTTTSSSTSSTDACGKTGRAKLIIQIIGHTNFQREE